MKKKITEIVENHNFNSFILQIIILNTVVLGLMTYNNINAVYGNILSQICLISSIIFTIEMILKLIAYGKLFFIDGWNVFDFLLVAISWVPTGGVFTSFRTFRILRTLRTFRLITHFNRLKLIVQAIIESIPNVGWACLLLMLVFYIFAIMGTTLYSVLFPEYFGTIGKSMFTLFQIMTLEGWADMARIIMEKFAFSWVYFISFILVSSFIVMNVIVGIVVNAISELSEQNKILKDKENTKNSTDLKSELKKLNEQINIVKKLID